MTIRSSLLAAVLGIALAQPGAAQSKCDEPTSSEWLRQGHYKGPNTELTSELVRPVASDLPRAIGMLKKRSVVLLSARDAQKFIGAEFSMPAGRRLRPYLVRAVFPSGNPTIGVSWDRNNLFVFAGGMGCFAYKKHPIVVFLDRKPKQVFVSATAAL